MHTTQHGLLHSVLPQRRRVWLGQVQQGWPPDELVPLSPFPARGVGSMSDESLEDARSVVNVGSGRHPPLANDMGGLNIGGRRFWRAGHMMGDGVDALCPEGGVFLQNDTVARCLVAPDRYNPASETQ